MKKIKQLLIVVLLTVIGLQSYAHCEIPCGIYDDELRITLLYEHFTTIEKSIKSMNELKGSDDINQQVRWIMNKEEHAKKVQEIVSQYFLHQRIKVVGPDHEEFNKYQSELTLLHHILVYAMKTKQTNDLAFVEKLRSTLKKFEDSYFEGKHRHHTDGSHK